MEEHSFPAAERILNDISLVFKRDPKLKEFQILPVTLNENKSPVHHVGHSLGLESWCVPHVYCYAHNLLMDIRQHKRRREDWERVRQLTLGALLLNPDMTLLWNLRRELPGLDPVAELAFSSVVLTRKPKSPEVFNYRKWLIKKLLEAFPNDQSMVMSEVHACELAAELYPNNYYAWNHRIWCLGQLTPHSGSYVSFLVSEWMQTRRWVSAHVSDHSGFQYRQHLLGMFVSLPLSIYSVVRKCTTDIEQSASMSLQLFLSSSESHDHRLTETTRSILQESSDGKNEKFESIPLGLILSEIFFSTDLIVVFPGHEAIWYHRRFLIHTFRESVRGLREQDNALKDNNGVSVEKSKRTENIADGLLQRLIRFETALYSRCKADKDRQANYAEKHRAWLASIMKIHLNLSLR